MRHCGYWVSLRGQPETANATSEAIKAYQERLPVICTGDLIKEGNTFVLKKPRHFALDEALTD
jgi:hypothetical protein